MKCVRFSLGSLGLRALVFIGTLFFTLKSFEASLFVLLLS